MSEPCSVCDRICLVHGNLREENAKIHKNIDVLLENLEKTEKQVRVLRSVVSELLEAESKHALMPLGWEGRARAALQQASELGREERDKEWQEAIDIHVEAGVKARFDAAVAEGREEERKELLKWFRWLNSGVRGEKP